MICCKFCGGKSQTKYLFLLCKHLSCLSCSFLRADFGKQQIECCKIITHIHNQSMENIIMNKRNAQILGQISNSIQIPKSEISGKIIQHKQQITSSELKQNITQNKKESMAGYKFVPTTNKKQAQQQFRDSKLENILTEQIQRIRKQFEIQRRVLKQKQQQTIKKIMLIYNQEKNSTQNQKSEIRTQKLNPSILHKIPTNRMRKYHHAQQTTEQIFKQTRCLNKSRQRTDYIIKKLELNEQRINERIQKHIFNFY